MDKAVIAMDIKKVLDKHEFHANDKPIEKIVDTWAANKAPLIDVLRKHPNWREDVLAIVFDSDYNRACDITAMYSKLDTIYMFYLQKEAEVAEALLEELGGFTVRSMQSMMQQTQCYDNYGIYRLPRDECFDKRNQSFKCGMKIDKNLIRFTSFSRMRIVGNGYSWTLDFFEETHEHPELVRILSILKAIDTFKNCIRSQFVDDNLAELVKKHDITAVSGQKCSKMMSKFFIANGVDTEYPNYNKDFAILADAINPLTITRHTLISVNPCDYLHMSYGGSDDKENSWRSCHSLDGGEYMSGTISYMLDNCSMIFYTVSNKFTGDDFHNQYKIQRQVICYNDGALLQSRLYPNYEDSDGVTNIRAILQEVFSTCEGMPNYWDTKRHWEHIAQYISDENGGTHYEDYSYDQFRACVCLLRDKYTDAKLYIGHSPICIKCGDSHGYQENLLCEYCYDEDYEDESRYEYCQVCGERIYLDEDDYYEENGLYYCSDHFRICDDCNCEYVGDNTHIVYDQNGENRFVCDDCFKDYDLCAHCGKYHLRDDMHDAECGRVCSGCLEELENKTKEEIETDTEEEAV